MWCLGEDVIIITAIAHVHVQDITQHTLSSTGHYAVYTVLYMYVYMSLLNFKVRRSVSLVGDLALGKLSQQVSGLFIAAAVYVCAYTYVRTYV